MIYMVNALHSDILCSHYLPLKYDVLTFKLMLSMRNCKICFFVKFARKPS